MKTKPRVCAAGVRETTQGTKSREEIAGGAAGAMGIETGRGRCGAVIVRRRRTRNLAHGGICGHLA